MHNRVDPDLQQQFDQADQDLPNFPEEVRQLWIRDCIRRGGWPPRRGHEWETSFLDEPLAYWQGVIWTREQVWLRRDRLTDRSQFSLYMLEPVLRGANTAAARVMTDSIPRYTAAMDYILAHRAIPGVLIVRDVGAYDILDGGHRATAWIHLQERGVPEAPAAADAWVARQPGGAHSVEGAR